MENIFAVYKPKGITSFAVVQEIKKLTGEKKVGHAGTLDPLAKGVLVIGVGREATKKLKNFMNQEKEYLADIRLGITSQTDDAEGPLKTQFVSNLPSQNQIKKILNCFIGKISQTPPAYSAVKIKGQPAYRLARAGKIVELKPRQITVKDIKIISYRWPDLHLKIITGSGFYVRSLARDLGKKLRTGAYLLNLERIRIGNFTKEDSLTIEEFQEIINRC